jgi:dihydroorotase
VGPLNFHFFAQFVMVSHAYVRMFDFGVELGTLRPGAPADITILDVREGSFTFTDSTRKIRTGKQKLQSVAAIRAGKAYINRSDDVSNREMRIVGSEHA